jgi:hypothetical protein
VTRLLRLFAVVVLVLTSSQLLTAPTRAAQRTDPVVLRASAPAVPYAKQLTLTATVSAPQPDSQVDFYAKAAGAAAKLLGSATAGGDGKARVTLPVTRTATYYAVLVVAGVQTAQSASRDVLMAPLLTFKADPLIGREFTFSATVRPDVDGIPVLLQRKVGGRWTKVEGAASRFGVVSFTLGVPEGTTTWRLYVPRTKKYGASASKVRTVRA